jgi:putative thioredoxin
MQLVVDNSIPEAVKDGTAQTFMQDVIEASQETPVIVDFWAPWCGPCKQLGPQLEKAVLASKGRVRMVKINIDQEQQLAASMRVQSIPAVYVFYRGQPIDGFVGAVPESQIKGMVEKLAKLGDGEVGGDDIGPIMAQAQEFFTEGKFDHAAALYGEVLSIEPEHVEATMGLVRMLLQMGEAEKAKLVADSASEAIKKDSGWASIEKALELAAKAADTGPVEDLLRKSEADPKNHQARYDYAMALYAAGQRAEAVDQLLEIVRRDRKWNDDMARKELLTIFEALGFTDPLAVDGRKKLSILLFS